MRNHDDFETKSINMLVPFSFREVPRKAEDHQYENDFSALCFTLPLSGEFNDALEKVQATTGSMKNSIYPFGLMALTQLIAWFPGTVGQLVMMWVVSKATVVLSNVPGPKTGLFWPSLGTKALGFIGWIPGLGDLAFGVSIMSLGERMYMAIQADTSYVKNPSEIRDIINRLYDEMALQVRK